MARRVAELSDSLATRWPKAGLIVVAVGYSSAEVRELLGAATSFIVFDEETFASALRARVLELLSPATIGAEPDPVLSALAQLSRRLDRLSREREAEAHDTARQFAKTAAAVEGPTKRAEVVSTRWEMLALVKDLRNALENGDDDGERQLISALLIANEVRGGNRVFDRLGGIYLELVSSLPFSNDPRGGRYREARREMLGELARTLGDEHGRDFLLNRPAIGPTAGAGVGLFGWAFLVIWDVPYEFLHRAMFHPLHLLTGLSGMLVCAMFGWYVVAMLRRTRFRRWEALLRDLRIGPTADSISMRADPA
jgi:hypothetical protein